MKLEKLAVIIVLQFSDFRRQRGFAQQVTALFQTKKQNKTWATGLARG